MRVCRFSLIELVVVVSIILLITGLAVGRMGKIPTFATQEKVAREVERLFAQVGHIAAIQGREVEIHYFPERRLFQIADSVQPENGLEKDNRAFLTENYRSLYLPEGVSIAFDGQEEVREAVVFQCFPDGTSAGPPMFLILNDERIFMKFSPLTGRLLVIRESENER